MEKYSRLKSLLNFFYNGRLYFTAFIASFLIFYLISNNKDLQFPFLTKENTDSYELNYKDHIKEVNLIYLGSSKCVYSNDEKLYDAIKDIKLNLKERYSGQQLGFSAIGVAADWIPKDGISHLEKFGPFNEIIVGNSWSNHGVIKYVGEIGEEASTPQLFLILRTYSESISSVVKEEKRILTLTGKDKILQWYNEGAPMPSGL
tara:strand:+ start:20240 stop:20848 length:609 start_codon:yes stop_codon:yes gene_type:complete